MHLHHFNTFYSVQLSADSELTGVPHMSSWVPSLGHHGFRVCGEDRTRRLWEEMGDEEVDRNFKVQMEERWN